MVGVIDQASSFMGIVQGDIGLVFTLLFFTAVIVIYSVFVYYFYKFLAKKNIIELNLNQYNRSEHPGAVKFFAAVFHIVEYLIILPVVTFFWFLVLSILILILAEGVTVSMALLISAALVASVRITAYVSENLSKDLAKMLPFTLVAIALTKPGFFDTTLLMTRIGEIPALFASIPYYLFFIIAVELIMRVFSFIGDAFKGPEEVMAEVEAAVPSEG